MRKMKLIILTGPPASGKSTFAKQYIQEHPDTKIVSRDEIRHRFGEYNHNHEKEHDPQSYRCRHAQRGGLYPDVH